VIVAGVLVVNDRRSVARSGAAEQENGAPGTKATSAASPRCSRSAVSTSPGRRAHTNMPPSGSDHVLPSGRVAGSAAAIASRRSR
jgi:hypothetical protein